mgnify:CR=1 FL=1
MKKLAILPNHPRARRWSAALIASAIALGACLLSYDNVEAQIRQNRIERLNARIENVYTADYQDMADDNLKTEKSQAAATEDDIFVKENPYGTNTTSLYVYFTTDDAVSVSYTVHADGYADRISGIAIPAHARIPTAGTHTRQDQHHHPHTDQRRRRRTHAYDHP